MRSDLVQILKEYPVIAAAKDGPGLESACESQVKVVFILYGDIVNLPNIVLKAKKCGKIAFVHMDLIEGLDNREISAKYVKEFTEADGIISTKSNVIKAAKEAGLMTVQRFFMLDSMAMEKARRHMDYTYADAFEILPGVIPKILKKISLLTNIPIVAGGLIIDKNDAYSALESGATAISTTNKSLWNL
ncbi:glycerol-3-phosphate responsive antiterminator [Proteiniclasticum sp.]|uniref:glycerol-3-phosphate responsive antiterminator n=1 Tax=Proteiniclasticum sp. TaxID=2053595 RepID=UPI0028A27997|nr:glycerol-3-phosphate responsive antiterminator [Proteiniclasticum sp.]